MERAGRAPLPTPTEVYRLKSPHPLAVRRTRRSIEKGEARARDISHIARTAVETRREHMALIGEINAGTDAGVVREMPRRRFSKIKPGPPPETTIFKEQHFHAGFFATFARCIVWVKVFWAFQIGVLGDRILRRDTVETRAKRFFQVFQDAGGSFTKIGQQLAMRVDLLPYEYCRELSKLLDNVKPFPTKYAIQAVERAIGKPIDETFTVFDPKPIGSATIACVYQAVLKNGDRVAVKVRRPNIGQVFATDLKAMAWVVRLMEALVIIRPGYLDNFIHEFSATIMEELDFRMEAYHQSIFEREARKQKISKKDFLSAPKSYYELSNQEVLVEEFVAGIWMWEILAAVESNDKDALARMHQLDIHPKKVAEHLLWVQMWGQFVSPIFHADPHPANIVVQRGSKLVFIDFGACGAMSKGKRKLSIDYAAAQANKDVAGAIRCLLAFMEPMPPIDMHKLVKELELSLGAVFHRVWSKHAPWYEKTSAGLYMKLFEITQKYNIPVNLDTVRAFRANMLYDTLAMRIYPELDLLDEIKDFMKQYDGSIKKQAMKGLQKRLANGLISGGEIAMMQDLIDVADKGLQLTRRVLERPIFSSNYMVEKWVFAVLEAMKLTTSLSFTTLAAGVIIALIRKRYGLEFDWQAIGQQVFASKLYFVAIALPTLICLRRITLRLADQKI